MPIDNCTYTFAELSESILPRRYEQLQKAMESPIPAEHFVGFKSVTKKVLAQMKRTTDFPGCYVFIDNKVPVYVGISRGVMKRLIQHLNFDSHYSANLAYRMTAESFPHQMKRDQAMKDEQFKRIFLMKQEFLRQMKVAFVEIDNDLELYLFEVFASMQLNTDKWNTFRTH